MTTSQPSSAPLGATLTTCAIVPTPSAAVDMPTAAVAEFPGRFRLLTKQDVCAVYGISVRCLENWIKEGLVPAPVHMGGRRYWHPERFYAELSAQSSADAPAGAPAIAAPTQAVSPSKRNRGRKGVQPPGQPACAERLEVRIQSKCDDIKRRLGLA